MSTPRTTKPAAQNAPTNLASRRPSLVEPAPPAEKAHQLLRQARLAAVDNVAAFEATLATLRELAGVIVEDEDLYGPGLHTLAREIAAEMEWKAKRLAAMALRHREEILGHQPLVQRVSDEATSGAGPGPSPTNA